MSLSDDKAYELELRSKGNHGLALAYMGKKGYNAGLYPGIASFSHATKGVIKGMNYLIGANSGVGKTTITDILFLYGPYFNNFIKGKKIKWIYFSFEISLEMKQLQTALLLIALKHKKDLELTYMAGFEGPIKDEDYMLLEDVQKDVNKMYEQIIFIDKPKSAKGCAEIIRNYYSEQGNSVQTKYGTIWSPNDDTHVIVICDSLNLLLGNEKEEMDAYSQMSVEFKNYYKTTFAHIQQFNNNLVNADRAKAKNNNIDTKAVRPDKTDFGGSTYTFRDADYVVGGLNPYDMGFERYLGINVNEHCTFWHLLKNRWGSANKAFALFRNTNVPVFFHIKDNFSALTKEQIDKVYSIENIPSQLLRGKI